MKSKLSTNEREYLRERLNNLSREDLVSILPACVVHESFPKRRKDGTSNTVLAGIAFTPDESGSCRIFGAPRYGYPTLPKKGVSAERAMKFVEDMRKFCDELVKYTDNIATKKAT